MTITEQERELAALAATGDEQAKLVYADYLEERARVAEALACRAMVREFFKCAGCCDVVAVDHARGERPDLSCACGARFASMGVVARGADRDVLQTGERALSPCDHACTHALGPHCDCACGGANHGSAAVVVVPVTQEVPQVSRDPERSAARRAEFESERDAVLAACDALALGFEEWQSLADNRYSGRAWYLSQKIRMARYAADRDVPALRTHSGRLKKLAAIAATVAGLALEAA